MNIDSWDVGEHIGILPLKTWLLLRTWFDDIVEINKKEFESNRKKKVHENETARRKRKLKRKEKERKEVVRFADAFVERQLIREKWH